MRLWAFIATTAVGSPAWAVMGGTVWTGAADTDWDNAGNWDAGVPDATLDCIVPDASTTPNDPTLAGGAGPRECLSLVVEVGGILDGGSGTLNVYTDFTVDGAWATTSG